MARTSKFSGEVRERAVRLVFEHQGEYASEWEAMGSIAGKIGRTAETLRLQPDQLQFVGEQVVAGAVAGRQQTGKVL